MPVCRLTKKISPFSSSLRPDHQVCNTNLIRIFLWHDDWSDDLKTLLFQRFKRLPHWFASDVTL